MEQFPLHFTTESDIQSGKSQVNDKDQFTAIKFQVEVDLFELMCKVLDQNLFAQVDWARNSIFFKELKVGQSDDLQSFVYLRIFFMKDYKHFRALSL